MEQELLQLLDQTLQADEGPRRIAEAQLEALYHNTAFPVLLTNIGGAQQIPLGSRQAALTTLRRYVSRCWSSSFEEFGGIHTDQEVKTHLRPVLLNLVTDDQRTVRNLAAVIVGKIATSDFPDEWPDLLPRLLELIAEGNDTQANGALHVLSDVLEEGLGDEHFFRLAEEMVQLLFKVATNEARSYSVRSLAVMTFKSCIDTLGMMKGDHENEVTQFASTAVHLWINFAAFVIEAPLFAEGNDATKGLLTLKIQILRAVIQIRIHFTSIFGQFIEKIFGVTWADMNTVKDRYVHDYVESSASEGNLLDADSMPCSLDLYVLEQVDFIQNCLGNQVVRDQIVQAGFAGGNASPFSQMVYTAVSLAQISEEDRSMWEIDLNVYLSEETAVSSNYTPRTASADFLLKLAEYFSAQTVESLFEHTQRIYTSNSSNALKEASLNLWDQLLAEFAETDHPVDNGLGDKLLGFIVSAIGSNEDEFLRARGYSTAATLTKAAYEGVKDRVTELMEQSIHASTSDESTIVQVTALRSFEKYCNAVPKEHLQQYQSSIIGAVRNFLNKKDEDNDPEDSQDVLTELVETIRSAATIRYGCVLDPALQVSELLFSIAGNGVTNFHLLGIVRDAFEAIIEGLLAERGEEAYVPLCEKLLPLLTHMLVVDSNKAEHPLMDHAADIISVLISNGTSPLPNGFVATVMPPLTRILIESQAVDVVDSGCRALKDIVRLDVSQLLQWHDAAGKSGMEITLIIIDRLLRPEFSESAAMEIGGLAAELVDRAGDQLGPLLPELLRAVAARLATASLPPFAQSLILVFARLVLKNQAKDVVDFLSSLTLENRNGLEVVMSAWLTHSINFSGYEEIHQNVLALCRLYHLQDPRLAQTMVQGDLIIPETTRILTRSRARENPDQYTSVSVPLKIIKLLIQELGPNPAEQANAAKYPYKPADDDAGSGDEEWEDVGEGLSIPGMSREELLAFGGSGRTSRQADDETFSILSAFFKEVSANNISDFQSNYAQLTAEEQRNLAPVVQ